MNDDESELAARFTPIAQHRMSESGVVGKVLIEVGS